MIRYSGAKGCAGITDDTVRGIAARASSSTDPPTSIALHAPPALKDQGHSQHMHLDCAQHLEHEKSILAAFDLAQDIPPTYIENKGTGVVHKMRDESSTLCGMHHAKWLTEKHARIPMHISFMFMCSRCCRLERNESKCLSLGQVHNSSSESD